MNVTWESYIAMVHTAGGIALAAVADKTLDLADPDVPRDTETLANSRTRTEPVDEGNTITVVAGYGRTDDANPKTGQPSAAYAVPVHERSDIAHPNGGTAKWLQIAAVAEAPRMTADFATVFAENLR